MMSGPSAFQASRKPLPIACPGFCGDNCPRNIPVVDAIDASTLSCEYIYNIT
jgi:hypothetical protein